MIMRLINADKLYPDTFGKGRLAVSQSQIADAPTVNAIPISVIEDIKAEIQSKADELQTKPEISYDSAFADGLECAVTIIDKHIGGDEE